MANRQSAFKHIRADQRKKEINRRRKATMRTAMKRTRTAITNGDLEQAQTFFRQASSQLDKAALRGVIKKGNAKRKKSRLAQEINQLANA